jgi:aminocarboxymuconate-semialdehyde decarboxylase
MEKWDVHTHTVTSPDTYEALSRFTHYADFIRVRAHATKPCCAEMVNSKGEVQREVEQNAYDGAVRVAECDKHGVTVQVLSPTPMMIPDYADNAGDAAEICKILNDDNAATVAKFPKRFQAIGALPMRFADKAIAEMERIKKLGLHGVEINSNIDGIELDDTKIFPIFAAAVELNMAVFIHPWGGFMMPTEERLKKRMNGNRNWRPWLLGMGLETALAFDALRCGGVHERLPKLRVMYAHGGGAFPAMLGRLTHGAACRPDLFKQASKMNPYDTVKKCGVYVDSLVHDAEVLNMLIAQMGVERVAMGSDYPYPLGELNYPGKLIEQLDITPLQRERLLSGTAKAWLGL